MDEFMVLLWSKGDHMTVETDETSSNRKRSPSYPAINLEQAIARAREIWAKEGTNPTPIATIFKHWGYTSSKGNANLVIAALRKFGLIAYDGSGAKRRAKLTPLAVRILDHPDKEVRDDAIREAALTPPIHSELWTKYEDNPISDDHLRWVLEQERGFSRSGALDFIPEFRETIAFANLQSGDRVGSQNSDDVDEDGTDESQDLPPDRNKGRRRVNREGDDVLTIPLLGGRPPVLIDGVNQITEEDWNQFMAVLNVMKPSLIRKDSEDAKKD